MELESYYEFIEREGNLRTVEHARRWSDGVLRTLGTALDGKTKRDLAKALPEELASSLKDVFWLLHFRDPNLSCQEFLQRAARRSGNSNGEFAIHPTMAVFSGVKSFINSDLQQRVADSLSPEIRECWQQAQSRVPVGSKTQ